ncbi:GOLPH3/VPS74 family protein [Pseudonocardia humida]|uniref:GPP34 family phosphoprotein n=1 Tax=Pseudonocardia humida TaxID=2800819 RepID=A0ABT1AAK1_9PSEU|nr:GPP34 family phosphoprotein [Pseudonocardia humida]MCO1660060.1 GPP34 family phosphoprotein [Pseudonocardia humida]
MELLICEEMLLLALDGEKGGTTWLSGWTALTGGVLVDAIAAGAVTVEDETLRPGEEPAHPLLRRVREAVAAEGQPRTVGDWVQRLPIVLDPLVEAVAARLVEDGVLGEEHGTILGLIPTTRFPEVDPTAEQVLRTRLRSVLVQGAEPSPHDLLLIALVEPAGLLATATGEDERAVRRAARKRGAELAERATTDPDGGAAVAAVSSVTSGAALAAMMGAVVATTAAHTSTTTTSTSTSTSTSPTED